MPDGQQNSSYSQTIQVTGGTPNYTYSAANLPSGLSIDANTGVISGTPSTYGTFRVTILVKDFRNVEVSKTLSIVLEPIILAISTSSLPNGAYNTAYNQTITGTGGVTPYTWSATGLPSGLSINSDTGIISGTPTVGGTFNPTITLNDSRNVEVSKTFSINIPIPLGIQWTIRQSAADNDWYSVCYGNGLFVAVAYSGTGNRVMTSPDGINWTSRTSAANNMWQSVCYGNGLFVAVAYSGTGNRVMTSPDGINWTIRQSVANNYNQWYSVCYGNGLFVAVASSGIGNRVMTSP